MIHYVTIIQRLWSVGGTPGTRVPWGTPGQEKMPMISKTIEHGLSAYGVGEKLRALRL
jgi:hypothetical protein